MIHWTTYGRVNASGTNTLQVNLRMGSTFVLIGNNQSGDPSIPSGLQPYYVTVDIKVVTRSSSVIAVVTCINVASESGDYSRDYVFHNTDNFGMNTSFDMDVEGTFASSGATWTEHTTMVYTY